MKENVFIPCCPQDQTNSDVVVAYGEKDFDLMTPFVDVPAKFGLAIAWFMFDEEPLISHMMKTAPYECRCPALIQTSIDKFELCMRSLKTPIVYDHARRSITQ